MLLLGLKKGRRRSGGSGDPVQTGPSAVTERHGLRPTRALIGAGCAAGMLAVSIGIATAQAASAGGANIAAARAALAPYTGHPSAFPVTVPLKGKLPKGTKFVTLQCSAAICALETQVLKPAVKELGATLKVINSGATAQQAQVAAASALALHPAAVLVGGTLPSAYGGELKKLQAAGIKVVSTSVAGPTKQYGINFNYIGLSADKLAGALSAAWVVENKGANANVVYYGVPEIQFTPYEEAGFKQEMYKLCPSCNVRFAPLDITSAGTTAPATVVSDLESHPSTNIAVFEDSEMTEGLPSALSSAGLSPTIFADTLEPQELEYLKEGQIAAGLAQDLPTQIWTAVDVMARLVLGQKPTPGEVSGVGPLQILKPSDVTFNPAYGYSAYPDFAKRFEKLWHPHS